MTQLWLKFTDENGEAKRILVEQEKFAVGRHSGNDLNIANSVVSRQHIKIERFADIFVVSDSGSSYGTTLNGADLSEPVGLKNGDVLNLGGEFEIEVELISDEDGAQNPSDSNAENPSENAAAASVGASGVSAQSTGGGSSIGGNFFLIAPIFGILILTFIGGMFFIFSG
ncbi:MAG TPA: FHA domain-containing protein, partial [Pyrinomonadaceae bacterium]|nr:FHA domain-containing protein [Pyrinomonadaceae bacterium]